MDSGLVRKLSPRLTQLTRGGYARSYASGREWRQTSLHQLVGQLLDGMNVEYDSRVKVKGVPGLTADFVVNGTMIFVGRFPDREASKALSGAGLKALFVTRDEERSDVFDHGVRVLGIGEDSRRQTIFLDDPSFNFDYAHILPRTQKCSVMHGHTSSALVEIVGRPVDGMVVDFGAAKDVIREAIRGLDHKLFINRRYVTASDGKSVTLSFRTVHGDFAITAPKQTTVMLEGEATVENLAREVLSRITPGMPENVSAVGVYVYEGLNKGSHLLAEVHRAGGGPGRSKP